MIRSPFSSTVLYVRRPSGPKLAHGLVGPAPPNSFTHSPVAGGVASRAGGSTAASRAPTSTSTSASRAGPPPLPPEPPPPAPPSPVAPPSDPPPAPGVFPPPAHPAIR